MTRPESESWERYQRAAHGMQSGIAFEQAKNPPRDLHKDLRVGINSALVSNAALVNLLVKKNLISMDEYAEELADEMEREVARYEERANGKPDGPIKFA